MSREELLVAQIRQIEQRLEDIEWVKERVKRVRINNKGRFDRTHQLRPRKIEEGEWVLVYDSSLNNHHRSMRKFARRCCGPYMVTSANNNTMYHLAERMGLWHSIGFPYYRNHLWWLEDRRFCSSHFSANWFLTCNLFTVTTTRYRLSTIQMSWWITIL